MTMSTWLLMLTLAVGSGTSMSMSDSTTDPANINAPGGEYDNNCWINGTWYNPCPSEDQSPWNPELEPVPPS